MAYGVAIMISVISSYLAATKTRVRAIGGRGFPPHAINRCVAEDAAAAALRDSTLLVPGRAVHNSSLPTVPVVLCVWDRLDRVTNVLRSLAASLTVTPDVYLWNNRAEAADDVARDIREFAGLMPRTTIATSPVNIGGFGRFYWAKALAGRYPFVTFVDDDQIVDPFAIGELVQDWREQTIRSVWGFAFANRVEYWRRTQVRSGAPAKYLGTGGMVADSQIFTDNGLFDCPARYWFLEDLWLSYYAQAVRGWPLYRSHAEIGMLFDGKDQYHALREVKNEFYRVLNRDKRWADVLA